ncbi:uncharacterized protein LOC134183523 isoform X2 [Corticium candelabrum]|uniref:uncharacterized protein LOC134183523 isoform X2 n=1 Tax=Corticium candelabrum TaxID=121492 RepID=UPI002E26D60F|nr:uncharacterized protein LOC134183523 isoform X2 [Corticium candelabrum]
MMNCNGVSIILVGSNMDALEAFNNTLAGFVPTYKTTNGQRYLGNELLRANLDFSYAKCFLVMPRTSRSLVYIEGDSCSMYQEVKHICLDNGEWHTERAFVVLYHSKDVVGLYDRDDIQSLWDPGPQKQLKMFVDVNQLISFKTEPNDCQKQAILKFLGCDTLVTRQPTLCESEGPTHTSSSSKKQEGCFSCVKKLYMLCQEMC